MIDACYSNKVLGIQALIVELTIWAAKTLELKFQSEYMLDFSYMGGFKGRITKKGEEQALLGKKK